MSTMIAGKVVIDGLLSAARVWAGDELAASLSVEDRRELTVAVRSADALGARLWPGDPLPEGVQRLIDFYLYQCEGDDWPGTDVDRFISAMQSAADVHAAGQVPWVPDEDRRDMFAPGI